MYRHQMNGIGDTLATVGKTFMQSELGQSLIGSGQQLAAEQLAKSIRSISLYTAYSKPVVYTGTDIAKFLPDLRAQFGPQQQPPPWMPPVPPQPKTIAERIKPTIVIDSTFGRKVIAPFGESTATEYKGNITQLALLSVGVLALYSAAFYYVGKRVGARNARKG
jgi:hypothetical protein